jgi:hypothetical protein
MAICVFYASEKMKNGKEKSPARMPEKAARGAENSR